MGSIKSTNYICVHVIHGDARGVFNFTPLSQGTIIAYACPESGILFIFERYYLFSHAIAANYSWVHYIIASER